MRIEGASLWALGAVAALVLVVALLLAVGPGVPAVWGLAVALVTGAAVLGGLVEERNARAAAPAPVTGPQTAERLPAPLAPFTVRATQTEGLCPLGFQAGNVWRVDGQGQLSRPLCLPAILAARRLTSSLTERVAEPDPRREAACRCPWAKASLTFNARPAPA